MTDSTWLWIGFLGMAAGSAVIYAMMGKRSGDEEGHSILHFVVPLVAMSSYFAMVIGQGSVRLSDGSEFYFARYLDWAITTPLLLTGLALTAMKTLQRRPGAVLALILTDVMMIATGFAAGASRVPSVKWTWYVISCGFFLGVYAVIWGALRREANASGAETSRDFTRNATILSVVWLAYPVVFLIGPEGIGAVSLTLTIACYTILDLIAKVAYGILSLGAMRSKTVPEGASFRTA